jgi:ATP-dependent DNA helicase HFM1/MER3
MREWSRFHNFNITILELTGDTQNFDSNIFAQSDLIVTTPEKWDSMTRKWRQNAHLIGQISLILIDEAHLLNTEERGGTLEAVITRMKLISKDISMKEQHVQSIRFIAVSATLPNI